MEKEEIEIFSQVLLDEDVSVSKVEYLISLQNEEERLDYKEDLDFSTKATSNKSKIDIVCDIVSMANTDGGYIILGVKQDAGNFKTCGVCEEVLAFCTPENLSNQLMNFVDAPPKTIVRSHEINGSCIVCIYIAKSKISLPFKQDGQYHEDGKNNRYKFYKGDIYVRHSAKSEKASYNDIIKHFEAIRKDERIKVMENSTNFSHVVSRLDSIVSLLGGSPSIPLDINLIILDNDDLEDKFYGLINNQNRKRHFNKIVSRHFNSLKEKLKQQEETYDQVGLSENLNRILFSYLEKIIPIWVAASHANDQNSLEFITDKLYDLYEDCFTFSGALLNKNPNVIILSEIIKIINLLGAISLQYQNRSILEKLIRREGDIGTGREIPGYWFRYVLTWLSRCNLIKIPDLIGLAFDQFKDNNYVKEIFDNQEILQRRLIQFDFLQCIDTVINVDMHMAAYPSFKFYSKDIIEVFIRSYFIHYAYTEDYLQKVVKAIEVLNHYKLGGKHDYRWDLYWKLTEVQKFMEKYKSEDLNFI